MGIIARLVLLAGIVAVGMALAAPLGYRFGVFDLGFALQSLTAWALYLSVATVVVGLITVLALMFMKNKGGLISALFGVVLAGGFLAFIMPQLATARSVPPIHDISTDTDNPPVFVDIVPLREADGASNPADYAGAETAEQQRTAYEDIQPLFFDEAPDAVFDRAVEAASSLGWTIVTADGDEGRIEASQTSLFYGFTDDVVIRIAATDDGRTRLDIRSKSRVGISDVGVNAKRIRAFRDAMRAD